MQKIKSLRVIFRELAGENLLAETAEKQAIHLVFNEMQRKELNELFPILHPGNVLNLLNAVETAANIFTAEFIVFEPDYLIDISSLAECFRPYGNHFLNYFLSRLQARETTSSILLGNTANFFIDAFVNEDEDHPVDYFSTLKKVFRASAFEFTACEDLRIPKKESEFFANCQKHFINIRHAVKQFFPKAGIDREKVVLEPSFISNTLGLQGRLDVMLCDYSAFIELKSGKAMEDFRTGGEFIRSAENHYIQMILYLAVLEFNLDLQADNVRSYLLYSKYPVLSKESHSRKQLQEALKLRNQIVAKEYELQKANDSDITCELLSQINSRKLNTKRLSGNFFENYLAPSIDRFHIGFSCLKEYEKAYFLRLYSFVAKELWLSKAGEREYEGVKKASVLWNAPFEDKLIAGELLYDLKITENEAASETHTISLEIPTYKDLYLPNFRPGDAVVLYERNSASDTVNNRQVFKGAIELLEGKLLKIRLRYRQKNPFVWNPDAGYAIEHDYMDTTFSGMFRALACFIEANQDRKDLLLPLNPLKGTLLQPAPSNEATEAKSPLGDLGAFLLIGPPGTGKTSIALKKMVETEIRKNKSNILLLAYTNRAVDEICKALKDISQSLPFIRIGSELNCAPEFREHLLENYLENCNNRTEVAGIIGHCRIFAGTVASVWNKAEIFQLKHFDLAIIDEATQLLEPHLLGIFCAKNDSGQNAVERFVLIGDHKQLPAVVLQSKEESRVDELILNKIGLTDLSNSLFERLYRKYNAEGRTSAFDILYKQGRMHPDISAFPSEHFYEGGLECVGLPHQMENAPHNRLHFYPVTPSGEDFSDKTNCREAAKVVEICRELYQECQEKESNFKPESIGIITPYRNQIALIRKQLQETGIDGFSEITVDTVERFQGSQRDIIIYSFCVKTERQLEALPNRLEENGKLIDRKLNVALTRARKQLYIVGNEKLLNKNPVYKKLLEYIKAKQVK
ncbi:DNA helicase [Bacteroidia bacterium]|nr:DNA helicase [Bacteroidia bacterium]GHT28874.1 DNA helicase [Bacteroidia bacterium]